MPSIWKRVVDKPESFQHRCEQAVEEVKHLIEDSKLSHEERKELEKKVKEASYSLKTSYHYHKKTPTPFLVKALRKGCGYGAGTIGTGTAIHFGLDKNNTNTDITIGGVVVTIILGSGYYYGQRYNHDAWIHAFKENRKVVKKIIKD